MIYSPQVNHFIHFNNLKKKPMQASVFEINVKLIFFGRTDNCIIIST